MSKVSQSYRNEQPGDEVEDSSYATGKNEPIPVDKDSDTVDYPTRLENSDSDAQLEAKDDKEAIDQSNIIDERTRGAKPTGTYKEPGDEIPTQ